MVDDFALFDGVGVAVAIFQSSGEVEVHVTVFDVPEAVFVFSDTGEVGVDDPFLDERPSAGSGLDDFAVLGVARSDEFVDIGGVILCLFPGRDLVPVPATGVFFCRDGKDDEADDKARQQQDAKSTHQNRKADRLGEGLLIGFAALRAGVGVVREHCVAVPADRFPGGTDAGTAGDRFDLVDLVLQDDRPEEVEAKNGKEQRDDRIVVEHFDRFPDVSQFLRGLVEPVQLIVRNEHDEQRLQSRTVVRFAPVAIRVLSCLIDPK